ncbi:ABC transporter, permease protein [Lachnospiraceae bacterium KM106-2]|nr:ABC transporter, permease protein [Lachnospiraceae bacterium KM106-2]
MFKNLKYKSRSDIIFDAIVIIFSILIFFIVAYPLFFVIIASISNSTLVSQGKVIFLPKGINFFGYKQVFGDARIWKGYLNTILYTVFGTIVNLAVTIPAAYALSRKNFRPRRFIMFFFTFTMFFNGGLIPTYMVMKQLGFINNILVFIIPGALNVYNLIITRSFFENSIPDELYEAASLDGCSHFAFLTKIVLPLSKAVVSVIALYYLVGHWNDFFTGLIYIRDSVLLPLQNVLREILISNQVFSAGSGSVGNGYAQQYADQVKYAIIIVSTLPILVVYPFIQKYFDKGIMIGAIKG